MAAQTSKSILFAALGQSMVTAHEEHKAKAPEVGQAPRLPAGIEGGIAELKECLFGIIKADAKRNAGKPYFSCMAVVKEPAQFTDGKGNVHNVRNMQTRVFIPLVEVPANPTYGTQAKTASDAFKVAQDYIKMLGGEVTHRLIEKVDLAANPTFYEDLAKSLAVRKDKSGNRIHVRFRTWKRDGKQAIRKMEDGKWHVGNEDEKGSFSKSDPPRTYSTEELAKKAAPYAGRESLVNEVWYGTCEPPEATPSEVEDETPDPTAQVKPNGQAKVVARHPVPSGGTSNMASKMVTINDTVSAVEEVQDEESDPPEEQTQAGNESADADGALTELATLADDEDAPDPEAQYKLTQAAYQAGLTDDDLAQAEGTEEMRPWAQVVSWIVGGKPEGGVGAGQPQPPAQVGEIVGHFPIDARTRLPMTKPVKAEVTAIDLQGETFDMVNVSKRTIVYKAVPWGAVKV